VAYNRDRAAEFALALMYLDVHGRRAWKGVREMSSTCFSFISGGQRSCVCPVREFSRYGGANGEELHKVRRS
jgi:hypothetical protein